MKKTLNIIGLILSLAGVILLFLFAMPYRVRTGGMTGIAAEGVDQTTVKKEALYDRLGVIGLCCVISGTFCQIAANFVDG